MSEYKQETKPVDSNQWLQDSQKLRDAAQRVCDQARALCEQSKIIRDMSGDVEWRRHHLASRFFIQQEQSS